MGRVRKDTQQTDKPVDGQEKPDTAPLAKIRRERYERHFEIATDQVTGMAKWLVASLFAANSGGVLTILNTSEKLTSPQVPGIIFVVGLIFALISAAALQEVYDRLSEPIADMIDYWANIEAGAIQDDGKHEGIAQRIKKTIKWSWVPPVLGWLSGIAFVAGATTIAIGFKG